jgi:hypothetical protein
MQVLRAGLRHKTCRPANVFTGHRCGCPTAHVHVKLSCTFSQLHVMQPTSDNSCEHTVHGNPRATQWVALAHAYAEVGLGGTVWPGCMFLLCWGALLARSTCLQGIKAAWHAACACCGSGTRRVAVLAR